MCVMDFGGSWEKYLPLVEFAYNNSYHSTIGMAPYEALYGRKCRSPSCWMEVGDRELEGPELIRETSEKVPIIQERMRMAFSRQKSYADPRRRDVQFGVGDQVFLKISPMKGVMRFRKKGKLTPRYIGPFEILDRVGNVSYRLAFPLTLAMCIQCFISQCYGSTFLIRLTFFRLMRLRLIRIYHMKRYQ